MAFDRDRQTLVLFAGFAWPNPPGGELNDTWEWNQRTGWIERNPAVRPASREQPTMIYDPARHQVLMLGGVKTAAGVSCFDVGTDLCSNDTWTWDGTAWTELHPAAATTLFRSTAAYEEASGNVVIYTFDAAGTFPTWTGDGSTWSLESSNPTPNRIKPAMTWDPARGHIVMFRGFYNTTEDLLAMWEWIGRKWTPLHVDSPVQTASGYSDRHTLLGYESPAYHGTSASLVRDRPSQTWQWDGSRWTQLSPPHDPNVFVEGMFDDPTSHRVLLVGREPYGTVQVWGWGGSDWSQLA